MIDDDSDLIFDTAELKRQRDSIKFIIENDLIKAGYSAFIATLWYAISAWETGYFTSNLFVNFHNPFGMKFPSSRQTTAIAQTSSGFAIYNDYKEAVQDIVLYMQNFNYPLTFKDSNDQNAIYSYVELMKSKGYFEESFFYYFSGVYAAWKKLVN